jgi:hypothetical protein
LAALTPAEADALSPAFIRALDAEQRQALAT